MPKNSTLKHSLLNAKFVYNVRPNPVPGDLRMSWGLSVLIFSLFYSRAKKSSFQKLQFLAHAVRVEAGRDEVRGLLDGRYRPTDVSVRVEPSLNRAVSFAHALKLVEVSNGVTVKLTDKGVRVAEELKKSDSLLDEERNFLKEVAPKITDALMKRVWRMEEAS